MFKEMTFLGRVCTGELWDWIHFKHLTSKEHFGHLAEIT